MVKARKYVVVKQFQGPPKRDDFKIVEEELPPIKDDEILVKAEWISVDPYLRFYRNDNDTALPYDQQGYQVGTVEKSKNAVFPVGSRVVNHKGWRDYTVINPKSKKAGFLDDTYKLPDLVGLPPSLGVGALGMPGMTAYFGFLEICNPKVGETVVVTGAAGAVGSLVGQMAKIKGCRVIGFAGSDDKVAWLEKDLGFDKAFNYKTVDASDALKTAAPNGIDCFFDNVGGELSRVVISQMNLLGRVSLCGSISIYNDGYDLTKMPKETPLLPIILGKRLKVQGFVVSSWGYEKWLDGIKEVAGWIRSGDLKAPEHVTEGFEKLSEAFVGMYAGDNFGKAVVKV